MKWFIPREHGAWAMLIVPFLLGMFASRITLSHLFLFIGILGFYFASGPLLAFVRKPKLIKEVIPATAVYVSIGTVFTVPILFLYPKIIIIGLLILPFFSLNIVFAKLKKERLFINDLFAIIGLSFLVIISYYLGGEVLDQYVVILMAINIVFFTASVFHVKTLIREKGNKQFLYLSHAFHGVTVAAFFLAGFPFVAFAFLIGMLKAWFMPKTKHYKPIKIGLIEIANSVAFVSIMAIFY